MNISSHLKCPIYRRVLRRAQAANIKHWGYVFVDSDFRAWPCIGIPVLGSWSSSHALETCGNCIPLPKASEHLRPERYGMQILSLHGVETFSLRMNQGVLLGH